eukprot:5276049-Ditylum_brightwellii.AAC.1
MGAQNYLLEEQISIAVTGFAKVAAEVLNPNYIQMDDPSMAGGTDGIRLITSIEQGPQGVHYFCTPSEKKEELIEHIDNLDSILHTMFEYETLDDMLNESPFEEHSREGTNVDKMGDGEQGSSKRGNEGGKLDEVDDSEEMETAHYEND